MSKDTETEIPGEKKRTGNSSVCPCMTVHKGEKRMERSIKVWLGKALNAKERGLVARTVVTLLPVICVCV